MDITFDPAKNERNIRERDLSFDQARDFDFATAIVEIDERRDYGEIRVVALGFLEGRLHSLCYVETEVGIRVISFRKANAREIKRYEKTKTTDG
ncbi:MAG: BrnT family toxin [Stellaceae bacterium]